MNLLLLILIWEAAVAGILVILLTRMPPSPQRDALLLTAMLAMAAGPAGALAGFAAWLIARARPARDSEDVARWLATLTGPGSASGGRRTGDRVLDGRAMVVEPEFLASFADVLRFGDDGSKHELIAKLSNNFQPTLAPALELALTTPDPTVRAHAAAAAIDIGARFHHHRRDLEAALHASPDSIDATARLARHLDDYAYSGILDPGAEAEARADAIVYLGGWLALCPEEGEAIKRLGRALHRQGRHAEALAYFEAARAAEGDAPDIAGWYLECLYALRDFDRLHSVATRLRTTGEDWSPPAPVNRAVDFWSRATT